MTEYITLYIRCQWQKRREAHLRELLGGPSGEIIVLFETSLQSELVGIQPVRFLCFPTRACNHFTDPWTARRSG